MRHQMRASYSNKGKLAEAISFRILFNEFLTFIFLIFKNIERKIPKQLTERKPPL